MLMFQSYGDKYFQFSHKALFTPYNCDQLTNAYKHYIHAWPMKETFPHYIQVFQSLISLNITIIGMEAYVCLFIKMLSGICYLLFWVTRCLPHHGLA